MNQLNTNWFEEVGQIGTGSFGPVFKYKLKKKNAPDQYPHTIAVKRIVKDNIQGATELELDKLLQFDHQNIVTIYNVVQNTRDVCVFMEHCDTDLKNILNKLKDEEKHLSDSELWHLSAGVAAGLEYLHSQKVIIGNLKPENILLKTDKQSPDLTLSIPKICSFGFSKDGTLAKADMSYLAPEVA